MDGYANSCGSGLINSGALPRPKPTADNQQDVAIWDKHHSCLRVEFLKTIDEDVKLAIYQAVGVDATVPRMINWLVDEYGNMENVEEQEFHKENLESIKVEDYPSFDLFMKSFQRHCSLYMATGGTLTDVKKKRDLFRACQGRYKVEVKSMRVNQALTLREVQSSLKAAAKEYEREVKDTSKDNIN